MKVSHIEHIAIAVKDLQESIPFYEKILGLKCYAIEEVADQKVKTAFFMVGGTKIELLEPVGEDGPVSKFIEKKGEGLHHIAFAVDNADKALEYVSSQGIRVIDKTSRKGAEGLDIGFLHPRSAKGVLIEFCSKEKKQDNPG